MKPRTSSVLGMNGLSVIRWIESRTSASRSGKDRGYEAWNRRDFDQPLEFADPEIE
jgi:hypothetical protein